MKKTKNKKLTQIIDTALDLFMRFGFKRVSVEEICQTAGVSKMTFYKHFKNKTDLLLMLLNHIAEDQMEQYHNIMNCKIPYSEKINQIIRMKQETAEMMGQELFNDLYKNAPVEITQLLHKIGENMLSVVRDDFIQAQKDGDIRSDIKPDFILYFMNHMIDMVSDENLSRMYPSHKDLINEITRFFFYGILTESEAVKS